MLLNIAVKLPLSGTFSFRFRLTSVVETEAISGLTEGKPETGLVEMDRGSWVTVDEEEFAAELAEDEQGRVRLEFLRVPPPTGTLRRVPP